jgi:hypothetical protein
MLNALVLRVAVVLPIIAGKDLPGDRDSPTSEPDARRRIGGGLPAPLPSGWRLRE